MQRSVLHLGKRRPDLWMWRALAAGALLLAGACREADESTPPSASTTPVVATKSGAEMVLLPPGAFRMGSSSGKADEGPVHEVRIASILMDRTEVTQSQYAQLVLADPSHFKGPDRPVEQISWANAAMYCNLRSRDEGLKPCYDEETAKCDFQANGYRLPTEAEWEYACRAGSPADYSFATESRPLKTHAWFADNSGKKTQPVAQKKPNAWGLFDMHGNVAEWCNDVYDPSYYAKSPSDAPTGPTVGEKYVLRGGAWNSSAVGCRASGRVGEDPGFQDACFARDAIGFRCVRRAPAGAPASADAATKAHPADDLKAKQVAPGANATSAATGAATGANATGANATGANATGANATGAATGANATGAATSAATGARSAPMASVPHPRNALFSVADPAPATATGLVYDDIYLRHRTGPGHPERPQRVTAIVAHLKQVGLLDKLTPIPRKPVQTPWLTAVHSPEHLQRLARLCRAGGGRFDSGDTPVCDASYDVALAAVGGVLAAVDAVVQGKVKNAFCAVRPPGHHATRDRAMGFCLLSNVAIAARYVQQQHHLTRVLIVDWDVHHGNGTQSIFDEDPTVLYFSVHQSPHYPGTGSADETGRGKGRGTKVNVPLPAGSGDAEYLKAFRETLVPAALAFEPDFVLISAGFDAHQNDPLGGMKVTAQGYAELTRIVRRVARQCCRGRVVSVLEGGYHLESLASSVEAHLRVLLE